MSQLQDDRFRWLYVGSRSHASDCAWLVKHRVRYIINATATLPNYFAEDRLSALRGAAAVVEKQSSAMVLRSLVQNGLTYCRVPLHDDFVESLEPALESAFAFFRRVLAREDGCLLVHCRKGVSRSVTVVVAFLMKFFGFKLQQALDLVKRSRSRACPNDNYRIQLEKLEHQLSTLHSSPLRGIGGLSELIVNSNLIAGRFPWLQQASGGQGPATAVAVAAKSGCWACLQPDATKRMECMTNDPASTSWSGVCDFHKQLGHLRKENMNRVTAARSMQCPNSRCRSRDTVESTVSVESTDTGDEDCPGVSEAARPPATELPVHAQRNAMQSKLPIGIGAESHPHLFNGCCTAAGVLGSKRRLIGPRLPATFLAQKPAIPPAAPYSVPVDVGGSLEHLARPDPTGGAAGAEFGRSETPSSSPLADKGLTNILHYVTEDKTLSVPVVPSRDPGEAENNKNCILHEPDSKRNEAKRAREATTQGTTAQVTNITSTALAAAGNAPPTAPTVQGSTPEWYPLVASAEVEGAQLKIQKQQNCDHIGEPLPTWDHYTCPKPASSDSIAGRGTARDILVAGRLNAITEGNTDRPLACGCAKNSKPARFGPALWSSWRPATTAAAATATVMRKI